MRNLIRAPINLKTFGNSMYPLLQDGDVVYVTRTSFKKIQINDVVCARRKNSYFTHRVVYKNNGYLITKGDNNPYADGKIDPRNVIGVVRKVKRGSQDFQPEMVYLLQSTVTFEGIKEVTKAFEKNNLEYVILKGLPLHLYYTGEHPTRIYADTDILVKRTDYTKIQKLLSRLGYKKAGENRLIDRPVNELEETYFKYIKGVPVAFDIHLEPVFVSSLYGQSSLFYSKSKLDLFRETLFASKRSIAIESTKVPILSPSLILVYLLLHLFHHKFRPAWRYEIIKSILEKEKIDFEEVSEIIKRFKLNNFVYPPLLLFNKYYENLFPKDFLKKVVPKKKTNEFIKKQISKINIFDEAETDTTQKTKYFFALSPEPTFKKMLFFLSPSFILVTLLYITRRVLPQR